MEQNQLFVKKIQALYGDYYTDLTLVTEGYQNTIYKCVHNGETIFIRVMNSNRRTLEQVQAELEWLHLLAKSRLQVPSPRRSTIGNYIEIISTEKINYDVVAFSEVCGNSFDVTDTDVWNESLFEKWGKALGRIHSISQIQQFTRPAFFNPFTPASETVNFLTRNEEELIIDRMNEVSEVIKTLPRSSETYGLIHNDFHQGNLLINSDGIGIIDFDDGVYGWYAQDIAVALYHAYWQATSIAGTDQSFSLTFLEHFLKGYIKTHKLTPDILQQITLFLRWRDFFLLSIFLKNWPLDSLEEWQTYTLERMRERIKTNVSFIPLSNTDLSKLIEDFCYSGG